MLNAACLTGTVLLTARLAASPALAVYALSFWHYVFYWWAYRHGAVEPARFRRDAVVMKSVALAALFSAYLSQSWLWTSAWHWLSALAIGAGFMLNLAGARALGHTRTYYGWELGEPPLPRVTSFPFSVVPHPMLAGNMIAFGGTLLHPGFRETWWPLAIIHVALNGALIVMETSVTPARRTNARPRYTAWAGVTTIGAAFAAGVAALFAAPAGWAPVAAVAGASAAYGYAQRGWYVPAASADWSHSYSHTRTDSRESHTRSREVV